MILLYSYYYTTEIFSAKLLFYNCGQKRKQKPAKELMFQKSSSVKVCNFTQMNSFAVIFDIF